MDGRALQDVIKVHCFGCGSLNERGMQIKSHWDGDEVVCRWRPEPFHIGHPGYVYGGTIASIVDCHSIWTALATTCRDQGIEIVEGAQLPFIFVTGRLGVDYLRPAVIDQPLELRARVVERGERRVNVECRVLQSGVEVARADVVTVRVKAMG